MLKERYKAALIYRLHKSGKSFRQIMKAILNIYITLLSLALICLFRGDTVKALPLPSPASGQIAQQAAKFGSNAKSAVKTGAIAVKKSAVSGAKSVKKYFDDMPKRRLDAQKSQKRLADMYQPHGNW